jgi:hypothetical protein
MSLKWAEFVLAFVQTSMLYGLPARLQIFPQNLRGLRDFLRQVKVRGINEPSRWEALWVGRDLAEFAEPDPDVRFVNLTAEADTALQTMISEDIRQIRSHPDFWR